MMFGEHSTRAGGGGSFLPRVVQVSVDRAGPVRVPAGGPLTFVVSIHEEGTALTWRKPVSVSQKRARSLLDRAAKLHLWSLGLALTRPAACKTAVDLGRDLYRTFLGRAGAEVLDALHPTAVLLCVDETVINLPWELLGTAGDALAVDVPFGRVVATGIVPTARRDPLAEDPTVRILVVANPTDDLDATEAELDAISRLQGGVGDITVEVTSMTGDDASRSDLAAAIRGQDFDIVHFAGHALFDEGGPHESALLLADGPFTADDVGGLAWSEPPYIVFNSACESARAAAGRRLVSARGHANGLAAAFLATGSEAYIGHYWPVGDEAAGAFAETFYGALFTRRNVGTAITHARQEAAHRFSGDGDLTAFGAIFFGDAGTAERRDLAMAV